MTFQISALAPEQFQHLFTLNDAQLAEHKAAREIVTAKPGAPCRVSLADAEIDEEVLLLHYTHQLAHSPFHGSHAIYVRPNAQQAFPAVGEVPELLRLRTISVRAFNRTGMMVDADLTAGSGLEDSIAPMLDRLGVDYLHLHFAGPGCYAARADRVSA